MPLCALCFSVYTAKLYLSVVFIVGCNLVVCGGAQSFDPSSCRTWIFDFFALLVYDRISLVLQLEPRVRATSTTDLDVGLQKD